MCFFINESKLWIQDLDSLIGRACPSFTNNMTEYLVLTVWIWHLLYLLHYDFYTFSKIRKSSQSSNRLPHTQQTLPPTLQLIYTSQPQNLISIICTFFLRSSSLGETICWRNLFQCLSNSISINDAIQEIRIFKNMWWARIRGNQHTTINEIISFQGGWIIYHIFYQLQYHWQ